MNITGMPLPECLLALMGPLSLFGKGVEPEDPKLMAWAPALAQKPSYKTHCVPLALHGDGVPALECKSLYVISGVSLLGNGTSLDVKMIHHTLLVAFEEQGPTQCGLGHRGHSVEVHPMGSGSVLQWCASKH